MTLPKPGDVVGGKYRVIGEVGKGGMGTVYQAEHVLTGKRVAVKWMVPGTLGAKDEARFLREARAAARVKHPNVVDVYDVGHEGHLIFIVMEYLEGEPLSQLLARGDTPLPERLRLLLQLMSGIAAVHAVGVVHRDLKPENVMLVRQSGQAPIPKLLDFGIAHFDDPTSTRLTKPGMVLGTVPYMSVEQVSGALDLDARSDVYSLGVILYETITGRRPFQADTLPALLTAILTLDPKPLHVVCPEVPVALGGIVLAALAKDRDKRIQSVEALARAIEPFAAGSSVSFAAEKPDRPSSKVVLAGFAGLSAMVVFVLLGLTFPIRNRAESVPPLPPVLPDPSAALKLSLPPVDPALGAEALPEQADAGAAVDELEPLAQEAATPPRTGGPRSASARKLPVQTKVGDLTPEQFERACDQALGFARTARRALTRFGCTFGVGGHDACNQEAADACIMDPSIPVRALLAQSFPNDCKRVLRTDCPDVMVNARLDCLHDLAKSLEHAYGKLSCASRAPELLAASCTSLDARCPTP